MNILMMGFKKLIQDVTNSLLSSQTKFVVDITNETFPSSFYDDMKPVLHTLRILGRLPMSITDKGLKKCPLISWPWLYSIASLTFQIVMTLIGINHLVISMQDSKDYDEYLFWLMLILILTLNTAVPFTYWIDSKALALYLKEWSEYQNEFFSFSKSPVCLGDFSEYNSSISNKTYILWMTILNIPFVLTVTLVEVYISLQIPLIVASPYIMIFCSISVNTLFWCDSCRYIMRIARVLLDKTILAIEKDNIEQLAWCRRCWVKLSRLTVGVGLALKNSCLYAIIILSVSFVISIYACLAIFTRSITSNYIVGIISEIPITLVILLLVFNHANNVTAKVGSQFASKLLSIDLSHLSPESTKELNFFLQSLTLSPPIIKMADYVVVDRKLITSFASNVITYLIVLLQFRDSGSRAINKYHNIMNNKNTSQ